MTDLLRRGRLFLGSYALLFVLLAIRFETHWLSILCGIIAAIVSLDMAWIVFVVSRRTGRDPIRIQSVQDAGPEVAGYVATYLLPFLTVAQPTIRDLLAYGIFLVVTGLVYVRSEMIQINPTLYILGRRVARITTDQGWSGHLVVPGHIAPGDAIQVASLNESVRVASSKPHAV